MSKTYSYRRGDFIITTDRNKVDLEKVTEFLGKSYWANTRKKDVIVKSIDNSLCFSLYHAAEQIGFARVITDYATFAYLCDVFIHEAYRGQELGKWLVECIVTNPSLAGLRRWSLATNDAHGLYKKFGFKELSTPEKFMEVFNP
ncbi:GNAT family N-acetyltransferase [Sporomusa sp.]|uniref:GNAT family N-acetyltransferase n=1 Tax=Sporomusa sp. TaxID=2078658 RepID=UPI002B919916|nr:GNAT family N-acetyltransferase [Sporomusa sp.]MDF2874068.1 acetyltransferase family protein [Sporomusa sp.]HWR10130.1 GNAT family N-acetyltransferase [Sporomusa sp.]